MLYLHLFFEVGNLQRVMPVFNIFLSLLLLDQTPTPTRFLRNCEEEGLFQDLENPFDQVCNDRFDLFLTLT